MTLVEPANDPPNDSVPCVFVSHSSVDAGSARALCEVLGDGGFRGWMTPDDVQGSRPWPEQILAAIERSAVVAVLVSSASNVWMRPLTRIRPGKEGRDGT